MKFLKRIGVFFALLFLSAIFGVFIFPSEESLPEWYSSLCIWGSIVIAIFYGRKFEWVKKVKNKINGNNHLTPDVTGDKKIQLKIPFSQKKRNDLAADLLLDAEIAATAANKSRTISGFIEQYDVILDRFKKLSLMNGKVTNISGDLQAEFWKFEVEFQKHLHDAIERSGNEIVDNYNGVYKYDDQYITRSIKEFKTDIDAYQSRFDPKNRDFANATYLYVCHSCGKTSLISCPDDRVDIDEIIRREKIWRESQQGPEFSELELEKVDSMEGHDFERFCASILSKNGFSDVEVTQGSGDQGVDVLAKKDGIKYAIQCKCYSSDLGNKPVQEVNAGKVIYHCHIGVVLTNRYFTSGAKQAAEATGVLLWDRDKLKYLIDNTVSEE